MSWLPTASGRIVDLRQPWALDLDFAQDIALPLGRLCRFAGQLRPDVPHYSVAEHSARGAHEIWVATGDARLALAFLLHDAHEAFVGDIISPVKSALVALAGDGLGHYGRETVREAFHRLTDGLDRRIAALAGIPCWLDDTETAAAVHAMDICMLRTERDQLLAPQSRAWLPEVEQATPLDIEISPWPGPEAGRIWLSEFDSYRKSLGLAPLTRSPLP